MGGTVLLFVEFGKDQDDILKKRSFCSFDCMWQFFREFQNANQWENFVNPQTDAEHPTTSQL